MPSVRTNLVPNPSAEVNVTGWTTARATVARSTTRARVGAASFLVTCTDASAAHYIISDAGARYPVTGGDLPVLASVWPTTAGSYRFQVYEYDAGGVLLTPVTDGPTQALPAGQWTDLGATIALRAATATVRLLVQRTSPLTVGDTWWVDRIAAGTSTYFDGDTVDVPGFTYAWTGTAHASTSTETDSRPTVTTSLIGAGTPRVVQVAINGLSVGDSYTLTGSAVGVTWPVRAGVGVASASQVVLPDAFAPLNVPVTYTAVTTGGTATSAPVVVDYPRRYVLQSLDANASADFAWLINDAPSELTLRVSAFGVPGRTRPVVRYDVPAAEEGRLRARTAGLQTAALKALLMRGGPLLLRTDGTFLDLPPVQFVVPTRAASRLLGGASPTNDRVWDITFQVIDDPEPNTLVVTSTWDDFDEAYTGLTWDDFDAEWAGSTWDDFDLEDWATRTSGA